MKQQRALLFLFMASIVACSTNPAKTSISNELTPQHENVAGTRVSLVPPEGFEKATTFTGFQHEEAGASILVLEIPGAYSEVAKAFTPPGLRVQGMLMHRREDFYLNDQDAMLVEAEQPEYGTTFYKYILAFATGENTVMINGTLPKDQLLSYGAAIQTALVSAVYQASLRVNPLESLPFSIDMDNNKLKLATTISNTVSYSVDGMIPTQSEDKTSLIVSGSIGKVLIGNKEDFARNRIGNIPNTENLEARSVEQITIDSMDGYAITVLGTDTNTGGEKLIHQVVLFTEDTYYLIAGTAHDAFEENLALFKRVSATFKRK